MVKIAVIGCGQMGTKIAGELAYQGHRVKLHDADVTALNEAPERIEADKSALLKDGLICAKNFVGQILCMSSLQETVNDAEFIFEAIVDDLNTKKTLFENISKCCPPSAILATNTLHLDVSVIAADINSRERILGVRFLFPVYLIPEVEITTSKYTSPSSIDRVHDLMQRMGKTLFFRSGMQPLILTEDQRERRQNAQVEQNRKSRNISASSSWQQSFYVSHQPGNGLEPTESMSGSTADKDCAICMDKTRDCLLCPCHHLVTCNDCAQSLLNRRDGCPICRKDISQVIHVYHS